VKRGAWMIAVAAACAAARAQVAPLPSWVDTVAPVVTASPVEKTQREVVHVSLTASEAATIWYGVNSPASMQQYRRPVTIMQEGASVVYFYAEDNMGNKSKLDSVTYVLDTRAPSVQIRPGPGRYGAPVTLHFTCDEPCRFARHADESGSDAQQIPESLVVETSFDGYITAHDRAGNRTTSARLRYTIDTTTVSAVVEPPAGVYNRRIAVSFKATKGAEVYYSLDPAAARKWFTRYGEPVRLPHGLSVVQFYAKSASGQESEISKESFVIDTVAPKIRIKHAQGAKFDTLILSTREPSTIRYARNPDASFEGSQTYAGPIVFARTGRAYVKAVARDKAGNVSDIFEWEYKYDRTAPRAKPSHASGTYSKPLDLVFETTEPARVFYTLDGKAPGTTSAVYNTPIAISKSGVTRVKYMAVDEAGNESGVDSLTFTLDLTAPKVKARIDGSVGENNFRVTLTTSEGCRVHYEIGERPPTTSSPVYKTPLALRAGEVLRYFALDSAGNRSEVYVMDDLKKPVVDITPEGGVYSAPIRVYFETSAASKVYWRLVPDTVFVPLKDTLVLRTEGIHTVEYYSQAPGGLRSPVRRTEYLLDWTPPRVNIGLRKGTNDSVIVFFEGNENLTVYYTLDGTNPLYSATTLIAANKFFLSRDRVVLLRTPDSKMAFCAEDLAGNQGAVSVLDFFKPSAIPSIPAGPDIIHDRMLSVSLNTYDERSQIYYERHAKTPTLRSPVFTEPITILSSDTIVAFVVDASGYRGDLDTFVYVLDLPPSPQFSWSPDTADVGREVTFDASKTADQESPRKRLTFAWDFDSDGKVDESVEGSALVRHTFVKPGRYTVTLQVVDPKNHQGRLQKPILVRGYCPSGMAFVPRQRGQSFCIDTYEWPNKPQAQPNTGVSWVRARMYCFDAGKRLCTADEWQYACDGGGKQAYPYGAEYEATRCPTEGESAAESGRFTQCGEAFGLRDMVGNAWEWVADKEGTRAQMAGGSFRSGKLAHCASRAVGDIIDTSKDIGFRCCR